MPDQRGENSAPGQQIVSDKDREDRISRGAERRTHAIGEADRVLRLLWHAIKSHQTGSEEQRIDGDEDYLLHEISVARGEIAEWRPATD